MKSMKLSNKWIIIVCLVLSTALVIIGQYFIRTASSPKAMDYEDAVQLLQQNGLSGNETAYIWKSKDNKLIFSTTERLQTVPKAECHGIYTDGNDAQKITVRIENTFIQVLNEDNQSIFEGYGKYDYTNDSINVFCTKKEADLMTSDKDGSAVADFFLMQNG